ncbi:hypothetical protein [Algoriphagus sp.]|nr:hypothetical protein [Algoriphagus sp.]
MYDIDQRAQRLYLAKPISDDEGVYISGAKRLYLIIKDSSASR